MFILTAFLLMANAFVANSQIRKAFTQRTSSYSPTKKIYNIKGDFTMIGNTNLTLQRYEVNRNNSNNTMKYVDTDGVSSTQNSSSATLSFSSENGALADCSEIVYAGLYWTGRTSSSVTELSKRSIKFKGPGQTAYTSLTASVNDILYPGDENMYSAYVEVTNIVKNTKAGIS